MKENSKVTDTNVGDIEENIEELKRLLYRDELTQYGKRKLINYYEQKEKDYKRVLKENEELLQEKINNQKIIALAQNDMLNYQAGFEDGKNRRTSAVQSIIENQQYYIFQKQFEKYEERIKMLQKENEELNSKITNIEQGTEILMETNTKLTIELNDSISKQKIKDIIDRIDYDIKKTKEIISNNSNIYASYRKNDYQIVRLKAMNTKSLDIKKRLQELLESEK